MSKILVTGASGYIAMHIIDLLIKQGHYVRGTVRDLNDRSKVEPLNKLGPVELVQADLLDAESWKNACKGMDIVMHVASPLPADHNTDESLIVKPAVEGTLNVLNACLESGVKRVVFTSSALTVYSYELGNRRFTEDDWVDADKAKSAYQKSKILAERAAWSFVNERKQKNHQNCFELSVVIPVLVLGPILASTMKSSIRKFLSVVESHDRILHNQHVPVCDVRDVALAHVNAAFTPEATGKRFIISSTTRASSIQEWIQILANRGHTVARIDDLNDDFHHGFYIDNSQMIKVLKVNPIDIETTIINMYESLLDFKII